MSRKGRPAGSTNNVAQQFVVEIPPACSKCGCVKLINVRGSKVIRRDCAGVVQGETYTRYEKRRKQCFTCGQYIFLTRYFRDQ